MKYIFRQDKKGKKNYTCISNEILQSKLLTRAEIGVLVYLLSLPENFIIHKTTIWKNIQIGRDNFYNIWDNLTKLGYIITTKKYDEKTRRYDGYCHKIFEERQFPEIQEAGETPVSRKPVNRNSGNWNSGSLISNKTNTIEKTIGSENKEANVEDGKKGFFSQSSNEGPDILEDTGPKEEFEDNSTIYFPSSSDYGKINSEADIVIPTEKYDTGAEIIDITDMKIIETSMKPKEIIPTPVVKSNISTGEAPEFLTNGIEFNGEIHYPLSLKFIRSTKTLAEYNRNKYIADELIKIIQRQRSSEIKIYQKNKAVIVNSKFLVQHKEKLSTLDYKAFIDYLNSIRQDLKAEQKKEIRQNTEVIKKRINDIEYYDIAIKEISNKMKT